MDRFRFTFVVLIIVVVLVVFTDKKDAYENFDDIQRDFNVSMPLVDPEPIISTSAILPPYIKQALPDYRFYTIINANDSGGYAVGTEKNDMILGTDGSDMFKGKNGNDIYIYTSNGGHDTILDDGGHDMIVFPPEVDSSDIVIYRYEADDGVHTIIGIDEEGKSGLELKNKIFILHQDKKINHVEQALFTKNNIVMSLPVHKQK